VVAKLSRHRRRSCPTANRSARCQGGNRSAHSHYGPQHSVTRMQHWQARTQQTHDSLLGSGRRNRATRVLGRDRVVVLGGQNQLVDACADSRVKTCRQQSMASSSCQNRPAASPPDSDTHGYVNHYKDGHKERASSVTNLPSARRAALSCSRAVCLKNDSQR
jgi:hypothetical protein